MSNTIMTELKPPTFEQVCEKVLGIFQRSVGPGKLIQPGKPLGLCGLDSLDLIEGSFALEEFFGFQFNSDNPIEVLDELQGGNSLVQMGVLTEKGREILLERMPELANAELPVELRVQFLPASYTIETFARLIYEFYAEVPAVAAAAGRAVVYRNWIPVWAETETRVPLPDGNELVKRWAQAKARELID
jgi:hypothetical protein